jgi:hypothetical protein
VSNGQDEIIFSLVSLGLLNEMHEDSVERNMHDYLYEHQQALDDAHLEKYANQLLHLLIHVDQLIVVD